MPIEAVEHFVAQHVWDASELWDLRMQPKMTAQVILDAVQQIWWEEKAQVWLEKTQDIEDHIFELVSELGSNGEGT